MEVIALRVLFYATQLLEAQDQVSSALPTNLSQFPFVSFISILGK